ncbi:hypothetical protein [Streptomyces luteogriseus]|uniref:hypothetical protein n=1 Tax=Streptomyces luteogriseus TaxID=68233 RepID=UPI002E300A60|nr:hypothetical protein [Streptomyces luteogriseus]WTJ25588.1 hypothetical protein OID52_00110 [Streptomyces luteogriseus]WTJ33024.1 hypothetical protein OID52_41390 [Streptomyces luteogriseus]
MSKLTVVEISDLPAKPRGGGDEIRRSWNRLVATHRSVSALFATLNELRAAQDDMRGPISEAHRDQARAAIVFTAAGIDACLSALLEDSLPTLLLSQGSAHNTFVAHYMKERFKDNKVTEATKKAVVSFDPRAALIELYVSDLTGPSIQSAKDLARCRDALGLQKDPALTTAILEAHQPFFNARHEVVHELDIVDAAGKGTRGRRHRDIAAVGDQCDGALQLLHDFVGPTARAVRQVRRLMGWSDS